MQIKPLNYDFSVCKVEDYYQVNWVSEFCFAGKTDEEHSLVCLSRDVPANVIERSDGWRAFRIEGMLDFSLVGILARLSGLLAEHGIGLFAISTFNTDYILVKQDDYRRALTLLESNGYQLLR